jgi:hypothetical protein
MATWALRGLTGLAVWGVYEFNTNDVGEWTLPYIAPREIVPVQTGRPSAGRENDWTLHQATASSDRSLRNQRPEADMPGLTELVARLWKA